MLRKLIPAAAPLVALILIPIFLRHGEIADNADALQLVVISPHNEAIKHEFEAAFQRYHREIFGEEVDIDWRDLGGTSEIVRYLESSYVAAFRTRWEQSGKAWSSTVQNAVLDKRLDPAKAAPEAAEARAAFLAGDMGIGIDMFFGGGQYDFGSLAAKGILVPAGLRERQPELFTGAAPILNPGMSGEIWYDDEDRYYGTCLSSFGICYNPESLAELGYGPAGTGDHPDAWEDLADPRLFGLVGAADPSKSGSINKCFEMIIQQRMAETLAAIAARNGAPLSDEDTARALAAGWRDALLLIKRIGGNSRYFTFSASKVPLDVAKGNVAAGMCIDFYGRTQAEWERIHAGRSVMEYITPAGGSSVSADPIGVLRGATHRQTADRFLDFVMSPEGQRLWNTRRGLPGGPERYALRRPPIRRDLYVAAELEAMSDPDALPFEQAETFVYHGEWTGRLFNLIRVLVRVMVIDCHEELRDAWGEILRAGGPEAVPEAMEALAQLPFEYGECGSESDAIGSPQERVFRTREWARFFRESYREAASLAARERPRTASR